MFANSTEIIQNNQEAKDKRRGGRVFPRLYVLQTVQNNPYQGQQRTRRKEDCITPVRKRNTLSRICIQLTKKDC